MDAVGVKQAGQVGAGLGDAVVALEAACADQRGQAGDRGDGGVDASGFAEPGEQARVGVTGRGEPAGGQRGEQVGGDLGVGAAQRDQRVVADPGQDPDVAASGSLGRVAGPRLSSPVG
ncbi:hypothetical protein [Micromonospora pattaloongensis]|uniref:hypothetical protein n=1 Tax=Micromonospora pattaloongensis TaxID=405436 RepID=UPI0015871926|nr:hypothetical protein [Micromonospora pattaloongensis]